MFALAALVSFVIGAVLDWQHTDHATLFLYIGLALLAAQMILEVAPWKRSGSQ